MVPVLRHIFLVESAIDTSDWHPDLRFLYEHWKGLAPPGRLPAWQDFNPAAVAHLLPRLWVLEVQRRPFRLRCRLAGTMIVSAAGREITGQWLDEAHPQVADKPDFLQRYQRVVETGAPSWRKGPAKLFRHDEYKTIENLVLPFASDGEHVDQLLACTIYYRADGSTD